MASHRQCDSKFPSPIKSSVCVLHPAVFPRGSLEVVQSISKYLILFFGYFCVVWACVNFKFKQTRATTSFFFVFLADEDETEVRQAATVTSHDRGMPCWRSRRGSFLLCPHYLWQSGPQLDARSTDTKSDLSKNQTTGVSSHSIFQWLLSAPLNRRQRGWVMALKVLLWQHLEMMLHFLEHKQNPKKKVELKERWVEVHFFVHRAWIALLLDPSHYCFIGSQSNLGI